MSVKSVLLEIATMHPEDRNKVKDRIRALEAMEGGAAAAPPPGARAPEYDWLTEGFVDEIKQRGLWTNQPVHAIYRYAPSGYVSECRAMRNHLLSKVGRPLTDIEKKALGRVAAQALAAQIDYNDLVPSHSQMMKRLAQVPAALEWSYPGFLSSGMLGMLIEQRKRNRNGSDRHAVGED